MTNDIPPEKLLPQDMVEIFDRGPKDEPHDPPQALRMHATDAKHAMDVEPDRYSLDPERPEPKAELMPEPLPKPVVLGPPDDELPPPEKDAE